MISTLITRVSDQLPLCASIDDDDLELKEQKQQSKLIIRRLNSQSEPKCTISSGNYNLHYLLVDDICILTITEKSYPQKLIFNYLDELKKEFFNLHANQFINKPYQFQSFELFIQKTTRLFEQPRQFTQLNSELQDVTQIMNKNISDLLWRGDNLDRMSSLSSNLRDESLKYKRAAKKVNFDALIRKYTPIGVIVLLLFIIIYYKLN
ncbi:protein transport protein SEC22 [Wallemia mellicola CBS 633.66]|uniref:Protein transport protein SEC22 n=1 Tax=Wallemia mellicola (strain ATCC MYA-4683 / CBS 633.66) TaxID=671144 RepID=I4Y6B2_WALMC|nr:protein transport protein SEC22 [Wallemia mellicola CBS 633.66]EIM19504.1 protein transport protein SEC22 [Wallemia mellicola CBS 633.66]TIB88520.1 protein transport protein SEC22 [Wallemia mellicola]TIC73053.1 protein transport protein SEC22 [Wallemia mellicola]|eukprot:XP_006960429.1 protein transport protein SEC22 [Wallemia mellicola CBS 633.66]